MSKDTNVSNLFKKLGIEDKEAAGKKNFKESLRKALLKKIVVELKSEVADDAEILKMIRVSPEKGEDRMRRYSKIITPGLGVPVPDQSISRLSSMDAATLQNRTQLQEVDDRRMTQPLLPSPSKIMGYNSVPMPTIEPGLRPQESL